MKDPNVISNLRMISGDKWTVVGMLQLAAHFLKSELMLIIMHIDFFLFTCVKLSNIRHIALFLKGRSLSQKKTKQQV